MHISEWKIMAAEYFIVENILLKYKNALFIELLMHVCLFLVLLVHSLTVPSSTTKEVPWNLLLWSWSWITFLRSTCKKHILCKYLKVSLLFFMILAHFQPYYMPSFNLLCVIKLCEKCKESPQLKKRGSQ